MKQADGEMPEIFPGDEVTSEILPHPETTNERSLARRLALQILYETDSTGHAYGEVINSQLTNLTETPTRRTLNYLNRLVTGVMDNRRQLDAIIQQYALEWPLDQVAIVDRNILRLAAFEFAVQADIPVGVAIDEAVELAKLFGADNSPRFVNGVLGALADDKVMLKRIAASVVVKDED